MLFSCLDSEVGGRGLTNPIFLDFFPLDKTPKIIFDNLKVTFLPNG